MSPLTVKKAKLKLQFYMAADNMMNRGYFKPSLKARIRDVLYPDHIMRFLKVLRKTEYYINVGKQHSLGYIINRYRFSSLGLKLGFSINPNVLGYGVVIPHYGTIVVGAGNKIGNYAVLHTSTCITAGEKVIGDALYLSTGAKIINDITIGDCVSVAAGAVVNKSFPDSHRLLAGVPAIDKMQRPAWYVKDGEKYTGKVEKIQEYAKQIGFQ